MEEEEEDPTSFIFHNKDHSDKEIKMEKARIELDIYPTEWWDKGPNIAGLKRTRRTHEILSEPIAKNQADFENIDFEWLFI